MSSVKSESLRSRSNCRRQRHSMPVASTCRHCLLCQLVDDALAQKTMTDASASTPGACQNVGRVLLCISVYPRESLRLTGLNTRSPEDRWILPLRRLQAMLRDVTVAVTGAVNCLSNAFDRLSNHWFLSVCLCACMSVHRSVVERLRPQILDRFSPNSAWRS